MNIKESTIYGKEKLEAAGIEDALLDARLLLAFVLKTDKSYIFAHPERELSAGEERDFKELTQTRSKRIPLQHITGEQDFMGLTFKVSKDVLIPRQDTEILVEEALKELHDGMGILDLCTGSGCIIISLINYSNGCKGVGVDISEKALELAAQNAKSILSGKSAVPELPYTDCGLFTEDKDLDTEDKYSDTINKEPPDSGSILPQDRITFIKEDILSPAYAPKDQYDIIVSNPPYIPRDAIKGLMPEVKDYDPIEALDGGESGLIFYERIGDIAKTALCKGGCLLMEIGHDQAGAVTAILEAKGFKYIEIIRDYSQNDRVVKCRR